MDDLDYLRLLSFRHFELLFYRSWSFQLFSTATLYPIITTVATHPPLTNFLLNKILPSMPSPHISKNFFSAPHFSKISKSKNQKKSYLSKIKKLFLFEFNVFSHFPIDFFYSLRTFILDNIIFSTVPLFKNIQKSKQIYLTK